MGLGLGTQGREGKIERGTVREVIYGWHSLWHALYDFFWGGG